MLFMGKIYPILPVSKVYFQLPHINTSNQLKMCFIFSDILLKMFAISGESI